MVLGADRRSKRDYRHVSAEIEQRCPAAADWDQEPEAKKVIGIPADGRWLLRFSTRSNWDEVDRAIKAKKFEATLKPRLDNAIEDWHRTQPAPVPPPIISSEELRITAPWATDEQPGTDQA